MNEFEKNIRNKLKGSFEQYTGQKFDEQLFEILRKETLKIFNDLIRENPVYKDKVEVEVSIKQEPIYNYINVNLKYKNLK